MPRHLKARLVAALLALLAGPALALTPPFAVLRDGLKPSNVILLDRQGAPISEAFRPYQGLRLEWTPLRSLSAEMLQTLLMAEDQRFFEHSGVDWRAFVAALWQNLWYERKRGASTLTMQLAGLLDPALHPSAEHGGRRTIVQKWDQTLAARELEAEWSKEQILEAYLNLVYYRGNLQGIAAASWGLFDKPPARLTRAEGALLSALLRAPNARPQMVVRRACALLRRITPSQDCAALDRLTGRLGQAGLAPRWNLAPELASRVGGSAGERIATTLDRAWQAEARKALDTLPAAHAGAVVVLDPEARLLAYAANPPDPAWLEARYPAQGMRLPLDLASALGERRITAAALLLLAEGDGVAPARWVSARSAASGLEPGPRQRLATEIGGVHGADAVFDEEGAELLSVAALTRALVSGGIWQAARWRDDQSPLPPGRALAPPAGAFIAEQMLATRPPGECPKVFVLPHEGAAWVAGVVGLHAVALRVEGTVAVEAALRAFDALSQSPPGRSACVGEPAQPPDVLRQWVAFDPPVEPMRAEWFLQGTERAMSAAPLQHSRIVSPRNREIVDGRAASRDAKYRVYFEARPALDRLQWRINGRALGSGGRVAWSPRAGLYQLQLMTPEGELIDSIEFAARGPL